MGGRGAYTEGKQKEYVYKIVEKIEGVKVLAPVNAEASHSMPAETHSSDAYIILDKKNGVFRQYREFTKDHLPTFEIGYHFESGLSENGLNVFHIHEYTKPGIEHRQKSRFMTPDEIQKYRKFFKGVSDAQIDEYLDYYRRKKTMTGRNITEFILELYNNPEMEFIYHKERYMISGYVDSSDNMYTLELWNITKNVLVFKCSDSSREKCVDRFEENGAFDGKTIYDAEDEIEVQYG